VSLGSDFVPFFKKVTCIIISINISGKPNPKPKPEKKKVPFATREVVGEIKKLQGSVMRGIGNFFFKNGTLDSKKINPGKGLSAKKITGLLVASDRALKSKISKGANKELADKGISLIKKLVKLVKDIERESLNNKVKPGTRGKVQYKEFNEYTTTLGSIINSDIPLITGRVSTVVEMSATQLTGYKLLPINDL
jgi:hypothetical protein